MLQKLQVVERLYIKYIYLKIKKQFYIINDPQFKNRYRIINYLSKYIKGFI